MKTLYRKWRPLRLGDVIGQEQVTEPLKNALQQKKFSHAYLFTGPRGTGKTSVARIFAHEVNGFKYELEDDYVDIIEIDGASNRGIENIREIREKAAIRPSLGKYKVYIIDEVHMLTREAFNALLKTLEEPPEHVIFIMATTDFQKVPITITSRAQTYNFKLVVPEVLSKHLEKICAAEKIKIEPEAIKIIVKRGGGSLRDSLSLLDQISHLSTETITAEMIEKAFGLPEENYINELIENFSSESVVKITTLLKELYSSGVKPEIIAEEIISKIIEKPTGETLSLLGKLPEVKAPFAEAKLLYILASGVSSSQTANNFAPKVVDMARPSAGARTFTPKPAETQAAKPFEAAPTNKFKEMLAKKRQEEQRKAAGEGAKNDVKAKLSAIMGGEVEDYGGGSPF